MAAASPIHFEGSIPNASGTPRHEVGGLAVFEGVLMRSRTGFALATRRPDGLISLSQFPFRSLLQTGAGWRLPVVRGAASLGEMMVIGTRALRLSADRATPGELPTSPGRTTVLLGISLVILSGLLVVLPNVLANAALGRLVTDFNEADHPLLFNLVAAPVRLALLVAYVAAIGFSADVRRVFAYHGAEHKAVLALEDGRDVTVARARSHDTLHPRCGTTFLALLVLLAAVVYTVSDWLLATQVSGFPDWHPVWRRIASVAGHLLLLPVVAGIGFELIKWAARHPRHRVAAALLQPGFWLQRLTTRQPNDHQIEVAIVALFGALAIAPDDHQPRHYTVRGLEDDDTAPGYQPRSPARPAPPLGTTPAEQPPQNPTRMENAP
jgi:uncharacterized protein YqhQ